MANELTTVERSRLRTLEKVIEEGLEKFVQVGNALREVKESQLYRQEFKSFEKYVNSRWKIDRSYAYRLIDAAKIDEKLSPIGDKKPKSEAVAREVAKLPETEQVVVWQEVCEEVEEPTAKDVRRKAEERKTQPTSTVEVDPVVERARRQIPELVRKLRLALGNLGLGGHYDGPLDRIEEAAR